MGLSLASWVFTQLTELCSSVAIRFLPLCESYACTLLGPLWGRGGWEPESSQAFFSSLIRNHFLCLPPTESGELVKGRPMVFCFSSSQHIPGI